MVTRETLKVLARELIAMPTRANMARRLRALMSSLQDESMLVGPEICYMGGWHGKIANADDKESRNEIAVP
jgi:preprotein translocase subunit YajC